MFYFLTAVGPMCNDAIAFGVKANNMKIKYLWSGCPLPWLVALLLVVFHSQPAWAADKVPPTVSITSPARNAVLNIPVIYNVGLPPSPPPTIGRHIASHDFALSGSDNPPPGSPSTPTPGMQATADAAVTVSGVAADSLAVAGVWCQLNGSGWVAATPATNGWSRWSTVFNAQSCQLLQSNMSGPLPASFSSVRPYAVMAYAVDAAGNASATSSVSFYCAASDHLTVMTNGAGTVTPNLNGSVVPLAGPIALTAVPLPGAAFANWTSGDGTVIGTNPGLNTTMSLGASFTANFRPTLTITNLVSGQRITNSLFTLSGHTGANPAISNVWVQLNGGDWMPANGATNWNLPLSLSPGTNYLSAYAVDNSGNISLTNSLVLDCVVTNQFTLQTRGLGTITPNYSNAWLEVGRNYTMTAAPAPGFVFSNWQFLNVFVQRTQFAGTNGDYYTTNYNFTSGAVLTNKPACVFSLPAATWINTNGYLSILATTGLMANFTDVQRPAVAITAPVNGQRWSNSVFNLHGTASDNWQVVSVQYQVNGTGWNTATGTNNWSANVTLIPGNNTIQVYAVDAGGNNSYTNSTTINYVLSAPLQLLTTGLGAISPNYSNALLAVGQPYTITAMPAAGFTFANWTGSVTGSKPALTFTMASNLVLTANFVDVTRPSLTVTNLVSSQRVSNSVFTVKGVASDNWQLARVQYQINGAGWNTAIGASNWSANVTLIPGNNTFQAYAVDTTGNASLTNSTIINYVVSAPLQLLTTGLGTISPNYSNALLAVGQSYTITATPGVGFVFTNWTGSVTGSKPALTFTMASNLVLTANFVDVTRPVLTVTNLVSGQRWSNSVFTVKGRASDNWQVADVQYQLNNTGWTNALGFTNWSAALNLIPGTNQLQIFAQDSAGNASLTNTLALDYVVTNRLQVLVNGQGTISPNYSNAWLELGKNYSVTAVPAAGWVFSGWLDENLNLLMNRTTLSFAMQSNLMLVADENLLPAITSQPASQFSLMGGSVLFSVGAVGDGPLAYQWQLNGKNFSGQNAFLLSLPSVGTGDAGSYRVIVSSPYGSITSSPALLTLGYPPAIVTQPQNTIVNAGRTATISVNATGTGPLSYIWYFITEFGSPQYPGYFTNAISSPTGPVLSFPGVSGLMNGGYFVVVSNNYGCVTSTVAALTVAGPPVILSYTTNQPVYLGGAGFLFFQRSGSGPLTFQWLLNGHPLPGQTNSFISLEPFAITNFGQYRVVVSNPYGSVTSGVMQFSLGQVPSSLAGLNASGLSPDGTTVWFSFGTNTFTQFSTNAMNNSGVGSYTYDLNPSVPYYSSTLTAQLSFQYEAPVLMAGLNVQNMQLYFFSPVNANFGRSQIYPYGVYVTFQTAANLAPAVWSGHTLRMTPNGSPLTSVYALSSTNYTESFSGPGASPQVVIVGNYSAAAWSPAGAVLLLNATAPASTNLGPDYLQLQFTNVAAGLFETDITGSDSSITTIRGSFTWK